MDEPFRRNRRAALTTLSLLLVLALPCRADLPVPARAQADSPWRSFALAAGAVIVLQAATLAALWARYRRTQAQLRDGLLQQSRLALAGELSASIAHEISQPIGAILSSADAGVLQLGDAPGPWSPMLAEIRRNAIRASDIIDRVRTLLSRGPSTPVPVDLAAVARNALNLIAPQARRQGIAVEQHIATPVPPVLGDPVQLEQVLLNLMINALQAMGCHAPGQGRLELHVAADRTEVTLTVTDNGEGIPPQRFADLFRSFFTTRENGMGLGLAIARSIVDAHDGHIDAANRPEGGAVFRVRLPRADIRPRVPEYSHESIRTDRSYCR